MMLDRLPEDVTILVAEHLPVLDLLRVFRLINRRYSLISRLPVVWARISRSYSIVKPTFGSISPTCLLPERAVASIAFLDDSLARTSFSTLKLLHRLPLEGDYPCAIDATKGGRFVVVACTGSLVIVDVKRGVQGSIVVAGAIGYERPFVVGTIGDTPDEKVVVAFDTNDTDRLETSIETLGICVIYVIDTKSIASGSSNSPHVEVISLFRPGQIQCLAISSGPSDTYTEHMTYHLPSTRGSRTRNTKFDAEHLIAVGWEDQVDLHDIVRNVHVETLNVSGRVHDVAFVGRIVAVLHSNPLQATLFVSPSRGTSSSHFSQPSMSPLRYTEHPIEIPLTTGGMDFSQVGSSIRFSSTSLATMPTPSPLDHTLHAKPDTLDSPDMPSMLIFLDGRNSAGDKLARCVISVCIENPETSIGHRNDSLTTPSVACKCSPWSGHARFDTSYFHGDSSKLQKYSRSGPPNSTPTTSTLESLSVNPQQLASAFITASSISSGSHHSISRLLATIGTREAPFVHTRLMAVTDGSSSDLDTKLRLNLVSNKLFFDTPNDDTEVGELVASTSSLDSLMSWDESSGRIFIVVSGWTDEWEMRSTLMTLGM